VQRGCVAPAGRLTPSCRASTRSIVRTFGACSLPVKSRWLQRAKCMTQAPRLGPARSSAHCGADTLIALAVVAGAHTVQHNPLYTFLGNCESQAIETALSMSSTSISRMVENQHKFSHTRRQHDPFLRTCKIAPAECIVLLVAKSMTFGNAVLVGCYILYRHDQVCRR